MKLTITVAALLSMAWLASCGTDDKVTWNCSCTATCDGNTSTSSQTDAGCGTKDEATSEVNAAVSSCDSTLAQSCTSHSCQCTCTPTDTSC